MTLRLLDLFSGIGGFSLAARMVGGFETVQFVEREPFCQRILHKHWPDVPIHDDICTFDPQPGSADVVCGGFPCQDISTAGKQAGIQVGTRSGLFFELIRVVRVVRPRYVVLENVAAIVSIGLDTVLGELAAAGYDTEWACIRASDLGACHRRDRWWCVAYRAERNTGAADTGGMCGERWGAPGNVAGATGEGEGQGDQWQRDGDAAEHCGAAAAYTHHQGLEGWQPAGLRGCGAERIAWPGESPAGRLNPDWRSYVSKPCLRARDDGLSGRVAKLKAIGNAVVPQVAAIPLARVKQLWEES